MKKQLNAEMTAKSFFYEKCVEQDIVKTTDLMAKAKLKVARDIIESNNELSFMSSYDDKQIRAAFKEGKSIYDNNTKDSIKLHFIETKSKCTKSAVKKELLTIETVETISYRNPKGANRLLKRGVVVCPGCGKTFYASMYYLTRQIDDSKYKTISCPCCNKRINTESENVITYLADDKVNQRELVEKIKQDVYNTALSKYETDVSVFVEKSEPKTIIKMNKIENLDRGMITDYLKHCVNVESSIYFLSSWLKFLLFERKKNDNLLTTIEKIVSRLLTEEKEEKDLMFKRASDDLKKQLAVRKESINENDAILQIEKPKLPVKPKKTTYPLEPVKPELRKPTLFKKKAILEENRQKLETYNAQLAERNESILKIDEKFEKEMSAYEEAMTLYANELKNYEKQVEELKAELLSEYEREYKTALDMLNEKKPPTAKHYELKQKDFVANSSAKKYQILLDFEIKRAKNAIKECVKVRHQLYGTGIIYPKYQSYVPISTICEYFESGRCDSLEGATGAYNLFEEEVRSNEIISQLVNINNSLEQIKTNQFLLYTELVKTNKSLEAIQGSLINISDSLDSINEKFDSFETHLSNISSNTAATVATTAIGAAGSLMTAYYSKMNAQYAKQNVELTNSLGYLVAFK